MTQAPPPSHLFPLYYIHPPPTLQILSSRGIDSHLDHLVPLSSVCTSNCLLLKAAPLPACLSLLQTRQPSDCCISFTCLNILACFQLYCFRSLYSVLHHEMMIAIHVMHSVNSIRWTLDPRVRSHLGLHGRGFTITVERKRTNG